MHYLHQSNKEALDNSRRDQRKLCISVRRGFAHAITKARSTEKETLQAARTKLVKFHEMNLIEKHTVQRRLRATQFSGHAMVDDLITSFAKSTTSIHCMAFM
jgi:hypothetical protein